VGIEGEVLRQERAAVRAGERVDDEALRLGIEGGDVTRQLLDEPDAPRAINHHLGDVVAPVGRRPGGHLAGHVVDACQLIRAHLTEPQVTIGVYRGLHHADARRGQVVCGERPIGRWPQAGVGAAGGDLCRMGHAHRQEERRSRREGALARERHTQQRDEGHDQRDAQDRPAVAQKRAPEAHAALAPWGVGNTQTTVQAIGRLVAGRDIVGDVVIIPIQENFVVSHRFVASLTFPVGAQAPGLSQGESAFRLYSAP
jgi:hypothetical protein